MHTEIKTNSRTTQILTIMYVLSWIAFIGLALQAGIIIGSYIVSYFNPEMGKTFHVNPDLSKLRESNFLHYTIESSLLFALAAIKTQVLYLVVQALSKVNMQNPFQAKVALYIEKISYTLLGGWAVVIAHNAHADWLDKRMGIAIDKLSGEEFFLMAGLVFIISQIFKRGVELQTENDLTV